MKKKILITGAQGQLGRALCALASTYKNYTFIATDRAVMDTSCVRSIAHFFARHAPFDYCIHAAAYTRVDKAETTPALCYATNAYGTQTLARHCAAHNTKLIYISTDYVFDGSKKTPYLETDTTQPLNVYGRSKRMGEQLALQACPTTLVIRTSWLYAHEGRNFPLTMKHLMEEKKTPLSIVRDQIGIPTYTDDLAHAIMDLIAREIMDKQAGQYLHYSASGGTTTWYDIACAVRAYMGLEKEIELIATDSTHYKAPAMRPAYSVLSAERYTNITGVIPRTWQLCLGEALSRSKNNN